MSDEDMLADLQAAFQQTAETGPNIDQKIADVLNDGLRKPPSDETIKVLKDKHKRPDNINNLQIPRSGVLCMHRRGHRMLQRRKC